MPHYTDEQARAVFDQDMSEVSTYYQRLAEQQRPAVGRAIENLTGQAPSGATDTGTLADTAAGEADDEPLEDSSVESEDASEDTLPGDPPPDL
jgi:hypothetical protein